jgi:hypothetical protein
METTHYSIVDQFGNAIAATTTLNAGYGSSITVMTFSRIMKWMILALLECQYVWTVGNETALPKKGC